MNRFVTIVVAEETEDFIGVLPSDDSEIRIAIVGNAIANVFALLVQDIHNIAAVKLAFRFHNPCREQAFIVLLES